LRFYSQSAILPVRQLLGAYLTPAIFPLERCIKKKLSATTGIVQNGALVYEQQGQIVTATIGTLSWYAWLETATTFAFEGSEGTFTAHKVRAGNRRGGWYWRAYRRHKGRLFNCYLGVSANLTLPCLCEAARRLATRSEDTGTRKEAEDAEDGSQTPASSDLLTPTLILNTKFALPRLPVQHVSRPHLLTLLEQGAQRPLTLVSAPAGSGKTTLLAEWAATTTVPVAWLSCESADNDPARFISYLLATLSRLDERMGTAPQADRSWDTHDHERALIGPLNDLGRLLTQDAVVILDDYHLITTDSVRAALHFLLDHLPTRLHLMIGTRVDPPLPLARLRARNQVSELRTEELRFVSAEVQVFVRTMRLTLSDEETNLLQERTEGWIAGIQLLLLALRGHADALAFLHARDFTHRFLLDYISEEILAQQTSEVQDFLLRTCILTQMTGPLCDAVTGASGGQVQLAAALRANLFVSALDDTQTWYRYHPLFAEALRAHLHRQEPALVPELYRRASRWYEQQHREEEACEYAFLAGDLPHAAVLVEKLIPHLLEQGKFLQIRQWLSQFSPTFTAASPLLSLASIWTQVLHQNALFSGEEPLEMLIKRLGQRLQAHAQDAGSSWAELLDVLPLLQAVAAQGEGDLLPTISLSYETVPVRSHPLSALSQIIAASRRILLGAAYRANGNLDAAEQALLLVDHTDSISTASPLNLFAIFSLAALYEAQGQLRKLGQCYGDLFQELARRVDASSLLLAQAQVRYAALLYEWNQLTEAETVVEQGMKMAERLDLPIPGISLFGLATQVRIAMAKGDSEQARQWLSCKELDPETFPIPKFAKMPLSALPARLALICNQLEQAERWQATRRCRFDDQLSPRLAGRDYFDYVTLARLLLERARLHRNPAALTQVLILLDHLRSTAVHMGCNGWFIEIQMLTALALQAQGKIKSALTTLGSILAEAEPEGYVRLFVDEGQPMAHLLAQISAYTKASPGYLQLLQMAFPPTQVALPSAPQATQPSPLIESLSAREQDVLRELSAGFSNQQIAEHLVISLHTVKLHVKHILAKLTVTNRTQAVARARELHLLSREQ
jgi:LuxR family maltose regulon positive regulatory protein